MACTGIYKVVLEGECIGFVERETLTYNQKLLYDVRTDLTTEIGELLPDTFRFLRCDMPVSSKQEHSITLDKCVVEERQEGKDSQFAFMIQKVIKAEDATSIISPVYKRPKSAFDTTKTSGSTDVNKPFEKTIKQAKFEVENAEDDLELAKALLESLAQAPESRPWHGRANFTCKNCHFKGHKVTKPCDMPTCSGFNECGILSMHPSQKHEINKAKQKIKDLSKKLKNKQDELESINLIEGRTKANFFSIMRPKLTATDPIKYSNRQDLENDLRVLAAACNHVVPGPDMNLEEAVRKKKEEGAHRLKPSYMYKEKSPTPQYRRSSQSSSNQHTKSYPPNSNISPKKRRNSERDKGLEWRRNLREQCDTTKSPRSRSTHPRSSHSPSAYFRRRNTNEHDVRSSSFSRKSYSPDRHFTPRSKNSKNDYLNSCRSRSSYYSPPYYTGKSSYWDSPIASSTPMSSSRRSHSHSINVISPSPAKSAKRGMTFNDSPPIFSDSFDVYTGNTKEAAEALVQMSRK